MGFSRVEDAVAAIKAGSFAVVVDDECREDEGDLIGAAALVTAESVAFMVRSTSGVLCVAMTPQRQAELGLQMMVGDSCDPRGTAFTVTVDLKQGTSTGISAADRAATIRALADPTTVASDFSRPGHVFPLRAREGGVLQRPGHTEAAVDLARMAGLSHAGVLAEIVNEDGTMARRPALARFAARHGLPTVTVRDLIAHRRRTERIVDRAATARLPTRHGVFTIHGYVERYTQQQHVALVMGDVAGAAPALVRVHSECMTGEVFESLRCDCRPQLDDALRRIAGEGRGVVVYLRGHEGRGIGLVQKLRAYALQDDGRDTIEANRELGLPVDGRDYHAGAQIIRDLGVSRIRLMTNNPRKYSCISDSGLEIAERVPLLVRPNRENARYLATKSTGMGHILSAQW